MNSATRIISDQIRMLQELKKLSTKPHFMEAVMLFITPDAPAPVKQNSPGPHHTAPQRGPMWDTGITAAILAAVPRLKGEFTYIDVQKVLEQDGYRLQSMNARDSIGRVLRNVARKGSIREVRKGSGGSPTIYRQAT